MYEDIILLEYLLPQWGLFGGGVGGVGCYCGTAFCNAFFLSKSNPHITYHYIETINKQITDKQD